ncbi:MAG: Chromosome partition protein Smc [Mycoplasmataceae bacterium]|nr:MAG: Chromosome partition protein Smc [Mycoplasmataceae bacterium]
MKNKNKDLKGKNVDRENVQSLTIQDLDTTLQKSKEDLDNQLEIFKKSKESFLNEFRKSVKDGISSANIDYQISAVGLASTVVDFIPIVGQAFHLGSRLIDVVESGINNVTDTKSLLIEKRIIESFASTVDNIINSVQDILSKHKDELKKNHQMFLKVLTSEFVKHQSIVFELKSLIEDKDLIIKSKDDYLIVLNNEYYKVLLKLDEVRLKLEKEILKNPNNHIDWNEIIESQRKRIIDSSILNTEQLNEEIAEKIELMKEMSISVNNLKIELALIEDEKKELAKKVKIFEEQKIKDIENISILEDNEKVILAELQIQTDRFHKMNREIILLENRISQLQIDKTKLEDKLKELFSNNQNLNKELTKTRINLVGTQQDLNDIQRLNFESKVKLQGVLFLDSMRSIMPNIFSQGLTAIETTIFISGVTNHPRIEKAGWVSVAIFITLSILYSAYQTTKFTIFKGIDFYHWIIGKNKDLKAIKKDEFQEIKNNWSVSKNYSKRDLKKARSDKDVFDINV